MHAPRILLAAILVPVLLGGCEDPPAPTINLYRAIHIGDLDQIKRHLFWGTDVNQRGPDGRYPLHVAVAQGRVAIARDLLKHGARVDVEDGDGHTPLYVALANGRIPAAQLLVDAGGNPDLQTVFFDLVREDALDRDSLRLLIEQGVDLNAIAADGQTALHIAVERDNVKLAKRLLLAGADINQQNGEGRTALALLGSVPGNSQDIMRQLLSQYGARP